MDQESSIKKMEKKLYAKKNQLSQEGRKHFSHADTNTVTDWVDEKPVDQNVEERKPRKTMTAFTKFFLLALVFFVCSVAAAFFVFTSGKNNVAYDNVTVSVLGPNSVPGGETLEYDVLITNNNEVQIRATDIIIKYPQGAYESEQDGIPLRQSIRSIDNIAPGVTQTERFEVVFFGTEGDLQDIDITFEYRVPDSNSLFFKERIYQVQLESSPVSLEVTGPKETLSGSDIELELQVISNANKVIDNLSLQVEYPFGFALTEAAPAPNEGTEDIFTIGALKVGETKTIKIIGTLSGQDDELRVFKHRVGLIAQGSNSIGNTLQETETLVTIARPPVTLVAQVNGQSKSLHTVSPGQSLNLGLEFINNLATQIQDAQVTAKITGNAFQARSIQTQGFYNSAQQEILWQKTDVPLLQSFTAGSSGKVDARFDTLSQAQLAGRVVDPQVTIEYAFEGKTFDFENTSKGTRTFGSTLLRIPTDLKLDTRALHSIGPFTNIGSIDLVPDVTSQYTIVWKVSNTTSDTRDIVVQGTLPPYVEFLQASNTPGTVFEYDAEARKLSWTVDALEAGAGYGAKKGIETTFQIAVTPSTQQIDKKVTFIENQTLKGFDTFTNTARLYTRLDPITSESLRADPNGFFEVDRVKDVE